MTEPDPQRFEELPPDPGEEGRRYVLRLAADDPYFAGHFPGHPVLPAVAQLDLVLRLIRELGHPQAVADGADGLRFQRPIAPGERIELHVDGVSGGRPVRFRFVQRERTVSSGALVWSEKR